MQRIKNAKKQGFSEVLFLEGAFVNDHKIEEFFQQKILHGVVQDLRIYDRIPMIFTGLESWPKSTNVLCWHCSRSFKTRPWPEPQSIDPLSKGSVGRVIPSAQVVKIPDKPTKKEYSIGTRGIFCSANCVVAYVEVHTKDIVERNNKISMLLLLYEIFTGIRVTYIDPAPSPTEMIQYGGSLTEPEFQKKLDDMNEKARGKTYETFVTNCKSFISGITTDD